MLDKLLSSVIQRLPSGSMAPSQFFICSAASILLGILFALAYTFRNKYTKNFVVTLAILPFAVQVVIMLVNGNIGASVAVAGTFTLVRFRSLPGNSKEILTVFVAMTIGLASGMGYIYVASFFALVVIVLMILLNFVGFGKSESDYKDLRITVPESLDYTTIFDDLLETYTSKWEVVRVKTTNMGSLYTLQYRVLLKNNADEKKFLDDIRCRNGNLTVSIAKSEFTTDDSSL